MKSRLELPMSAFHRVRVWLGCNLKELLVCSPKPYKEALCKGREEESCWYCSLKTRNVAGSEGSGTALKRTSLEDLRETVKPNGVVL